MILEDEYLRIGKIIGSHALNGRLKVYVITDILSRFASGNKIFLKLSGKYEARVVKDFKLSKKNNALLVLEGVNDRNASDALKGAEIFIEKKTAELGKDGLDDASFYYYDLIGSAIYMHDEEFGELVDIMDAGAGDILIIKNKAGEEILIPFIDEMVSTELLSQGRIDITPAEGMLDI